MPELPAPDPSRRAVTAAAGLDAVLALAGERAVPGRPAVVLVDGPAGAGKTVLAGRLQHALPDCTVVHLDELVPGWDGLAAAPPRLVEGVLTPLALGRPGRYRSWDWLAGAPGDQVEVPATRFVVVEGVGSGGRAAAALAAVLVWVDAPAELRHRRAIARDGETFRPHWDRWAAQERVLFAAERTRDRADVVIDSAAPVPG